MFLDKRYNFGNQNSLTVLGNGFGGGRVFSFMNAKTTQDTIVWLLRNAQYSDDIKIAFYTYDLLTISEAVYAARQNGNNVSMCGNYNSCLGAATRDQLNRVIALRGAGVNVFLVAGMDIQPEYAKVGKKVRPGHGILHMKTALIGSWLVVGSTNFTTSSRNNHELSTLLWLDKSSVQVYHKLFDDLVAAGEPLTDQIIAIAEAEQEKKRLQKQKDKEAKGTSSKSFASSSKQ